MKTGEDRGGRTGWEKSVRTEGEGLGEGQGGKKRVRT